MAMVLSNFKLNSIFWNFWNFISVERFKVHGFLFNLVMNRKFQPTNGISCNTHFGFGRPPKRTVFFMFCMNTRICIVSIFENCKKITKGNYYTHLFFLPNPNGSESLEYGHVVQKAQHIFYLKFK